MPTKKWLTIGVSQETKEKLQRFQKLYSAGKEKKYRLCSIDSTVEHLVQEALDDMGPGNPYRDEDRIVDQQTYHPVCRDCWKVINPEYILRKERKVESKQFPSPGITDCSFCERKTDSGIKIPAQDAPNCEILEHIHSIKNTFDNDVLYPSNQEKPAKHIHDPSDSYDEQFLKANNSPSGQYPKTGW